MKIALLGYGTIGTGVFQIINERPDLEIVKILEKKEKFDPNYLALFTNNIDDIIGDETIDLVVEVLGGYDFAKNCIEKSLKSGKNVVTANKEIIAKDLEELLSLAKSNNVHLAYEASVGGGIPIIRNLQSLVELNQIKKISGILNGTTNYILTKMHEGMTFSEALLEAQRLGFAESDPTADLEGYDMMRKIAILSDIAWSTFVDIAKIHHQGIKNITLSDVENAKKNGEIIKFVCESSILNDEIQIEVKPKRFPNNHFFASVNNEFNAVILETIPNDKLIFIGKGAGAFPTASAIVEDILDIKNNNLRENYHNINNYQINGGCK